MIWSKTCPYCGGLFRTADEHRRFCCDEHEADWRPTPPPDLSEMRRCRWLPCGSLFKPSRHRRIYCSPQCRDATLMAERSARPCANPKCREIIPAKAHGRRRFHSEACRERHYAELERRGCCSKCGRAPSKKLTA